MRSIAMRSCPGCGRLCDLETMIGQEETVITMRCPACGNAVCEERVKAGERYCIELVMVETHTAKEGADDEDSDSDGLRATDTRG